MVRRAGAVLTVIMTLLAVSGCDRFNMPAPGLPSLPVVFGSRVTDGQLRLWTGAPCEGTVRVGLTFQPGYVSLELKATTVQGVRVDHVTLGGPYPPGLEITKPLPAGFDWRTATSVEFPIDVTTGDVGGGSSSDLAEIIDHSDEHPDDTYWFQKEGWLNPAEVAAKDGKTLLTPCTPDPAKAPSLPRAFGARVTEGTLRVWTGSRCRGTDRVILTFQPGQADLVLEPDGLVGEEFERLTLGGPYPDFKVTEPLPYGFDWRTAQTLFLRVDADRMGWPSTTDLTEVVSGSAEHPDDSYFFEGIGWLSPSDVAAKDGKDFLATCTRDPGK